MGGSGCVRGSVLKSQSSKVKCGLSVVPWKSQLLPFGAVVKSLRAAKATMCSSQLLSQLSEKTIPEVLKLQRWVTGRL